MITAAGSVLGLVVILLGFAGISTKLHNDYQRARHDLRRRK